MFRTLFVLLLAAAAPSSPVAAAPAGLSAGAMTYAVLPSGRYNIAVLGMLTTTCGRAIEMELAKLPEVASASVDFDAERLDLTVKVNHALSSSALRKALHRAARIINLETDYYVGGITFLP